MKEINMDGLSGYCDFAIAIDSTLLAAGIFEHSKTKVRALGARFGLKSIKIGWQTFQTKNPLGYNVDYMRIPLGSGRDQFYYALATSKEVGKRFFVSCNETIDQDLYDYLMQRYKLPLLREWMPALLRNGKYLGFIKEVFSNCVVSTTRCITLHGNSMELSKLRVFDMEGLTDSTFERLVSESLKEKSIWISKKEMRPLSFPNFDDYIAKFGQSLIANLEKELNPLCELNGVVDTVALKHKRLFPQQAACVNGIVALKKAGIKYGIANEGMGCGKTVQAMSVAEAYFVEEYLRKHPGKSLLNAYQDGVINYRNIIMAPGHLVEKWANEIRQEIPFAKVTILHNFSQLVEIREHGKRRNGKEFFILSKDFCKLGSQVSPIPTKVIHNGTIAVPICKDCYEDRDLVYYKQGTGKTAVCPSCGGHNFMIYHMGHSIPKASGLACPNCNELLLASGKISDMLNSYADNTDRGIVLKPKDFAKKTTANTRCLLCNAQLWGVNSRPVDVGGEFSKLASRKPKWYKISHYKNLHRKSKETAFVLKGYEKGYLVSHKVKADDFKILASEYGPRKVAPAAYIKKYLKGYFDFCILDECHKYEGAGTAQSNAAHSLINASDFTIGLTGTISNGSAGSFFWLLWMLDPIRMQEKGYSYSAGDCMRFCKTYGSVETIYEATGGSEIYNSASKGRQLSQPKMKPGISPMLFVDFLLDRCVMLDITDLSRYLPKLTETVITVPMMNDVYQQYRSTIEELKEASHSREGMNALTSMLNFGLSYPDKPYGRKDITSAYEKDTTIATVKNFEEFSSIDHLLPKEQKLVEIVRKEISEDRGCFVYASYTGEGESNIVYRLQSIIEKHCNLKGMVQILQASSPEPLKREEWIMQKASEGIKVFICNPKVVETGLDFCFTYKGGKYNYPTLIFMQVGYELSVIWQASRRAYRLNQWADCRNYYLAYEGTLQTAALEIMAQKQVATSAIQGKFSSEGLAAMAKGVDTRTQLAAALAAEDMSDRKSLENMFDALNAQNNSSDDNYDEYTPPKTYFELVGIIEQLESDKILPESQISFFETTFTDFVHERGSCETNIVEEHLICDADNLEFDSFFASFFDCDSLRNEIFNSAIKEPEKKRQKTKKTVPDGSYTFYELFAI